MRIPLSWLVEHLGEAEEISVDRFTDALTQLGIEVEEVTEVGGVTGPLVIGRVAEIEELTGFKKPIRFCRIEIGADNGEPDFRGIVCGATNFVEGDLVVVALSGAELPGGFTISARKTYDRVSEGMICSARELGIGEDHTGILVLPSGLAEPGADAVKTLELADTVFDLEITPDRGYCLSVRGLARELSCALNLPYGDPAAIDVPEAEGEAWPVTIADPDGCSRFVVRRVNGIDPTAPTPWWIRRRLMLAGIRSLSLVVDVTNYVMLELGQPLHAYDVSRLRGGITVRKAAAGEKLTTLDGVKRDLDTDDLLICDESGPIGLAGVMGGESTEIHSGSSEVLLEAAHFDPATIARAARRFKLPSEASRRFERFVDPALPPVAAERASRLLHRYGEGTIEPGRTDVGHVEPAPPVTMPINLPDQVAGVNYARGVTAGRLSQIGCRVEVDTASDGTPVVIASPPSWRNDIARPADLVEEVLRLEGYDTIPSQLPRVPAGRGLTDQQRRGRSVSRALAEAGYVEVLPFPFVSESTWNDFGLSEEDSRRRTLRLLNPLDADVAELATTLLPGMLDALRRNFARGNRDLALFHMGQVTLPKAERTPVPEVGVGTRPTDDQLTALHAALPAQPKHVAVVLTGDRQRSGWWGKGEPASWADAVQAARLVADTCGAELTVRAHEQAPWHPGRCAQLRIGDWPVGYAGELHPKVVEKLGLPKPTVAMELDLDAIPLVERRTAPVVSPYPPVLLDVALIVDAEVPAAEVAGALRDGAGKLLEELNLFDVYTGSQVGEGKRSLAYSLRFRAPDRTLKLTEATKARDAAVIAVADRFGASLRA